MLTRRTLLGGAALVAAAPVLSAITATATRGTDNVARRSGQPPGGSAALRPRHGVRLAAALNRGILLATSNQPDATATRFYRVPKTDHCARLVHAATAGGAGYAFQYDDVHTAGYNTEGRVVNPRPTKLTIHVG